VEPGHYIAHPQTLNMMESEYLYPAMADRSSLSQWLSKPGPDMATKAEAEAARLLAGHFPGHISEETDVAIRLAFDIRLPRDRMRPA
jgi:trimethylamine--corrinoid protein Co-methyltransferase